MFPLGSVLLPGMAMPLRVFEERYLALVESVASTGRPFGVVLIERGFEVGGGDGRFAVGTFAHLAEAVDLGGGDLGILVEGGGRFRVSTWLTESPYPLASVEVLAETDGFSPDVAGAEASVRQALTLLSELGYDVGLDHLAVPDDPIGASWALAALCPVGPLDAQSLLEADDAAIRLQLTKELADEHAALSRMRLAGR